EMLSQAIEHYEWTARRKQIALALEADPLPPLVADEGQLRRVVANLLANAVKYTPNGGRGTVSAASDRVHVATAFVDHRRGSTAACARRSARRAPGSASSSPRRSWRRTAGTSGSRAPRASDPRSPCCCRQPSTRPKTSWVALSPRRGRRRSSRGRRAWPDGC